jgi:hypothetical protein
LGGQERLDERFAGGRSSTKNWHIVEGGCNLAGEITDGLQRTLLCR